MDKLAIYSATLARGGAERVTVYLAEYFVNCGIECEIITARKYEREYPVPQGVNRVVLSKGNGITLGSILVLRQAIKRSSADTLLVMGAPDCVAAILACIGLKVKVIVSERNDPKHFAGKRATRLLYNMLLPLADGYVFQTEDAKAYYRKRLKDRGRVISNPLFTDGLPDVYVGERRKTIVSVGRLAKQKNQKLLLEAFASLAQDYPAYDLVIYGEGGLRGELEQKIDSLGLQERVHMPGSRADVLEQIKDAALFVMSSDFEGMPNALIEAMALGLPCVSTDCPCGGPRFLIISGENGLLVPVGEVEPMARAMRTMLDDLQKAFKMGEKATYVREKLAVETIGDQWKAYLSEISG